MMDAFPFEPVLRLWVLLSCGAISAAIGSALLLSHAAEKAFRDAAQRNHPTKPNLVPVPPGNVGTRSGLNVVGHQEAPHENAPTIHAERSNVLAFRSPNNSRRAG